MFEFFWLEIVTAACAAPLVLHAIRAELVAKFCTRYGVPPGMSYHVMVFHPRY